MCQEKIDVVSVRDKRMAYEVEQYLTGLPFVDDVDVDFLDDTIVIEYDDAIDHERILDEIEQSGCTPTETLGGVVGTMKATITSKLR